MTYTVLALLVVIIVAVYVANRRYHFVPFMDNEYFVARGSDDRAAAMMLAELTDKTTTMIAHLKRKYPSSRVTRSILRNYNPDAVAEIVPNNAFGHTSYTVDRGKMMRVCMRDKSTHQLHNINDLMFVVIHEMAHIANWESDHSTEFWIDFKFLLRAAAEAGVYSPVNYQLAPIVYCGMPVAYNPYFDTSL